MMKNYVLQKKKKVLFCKKVGTPGTSGVDGPGVVFLNETVIFFWN